MSAERSEIPTWECLNLLGAAGVGRVCVIDHGVPLAFPINFRLTGDDGASRIVMRSGASSIVGRYEGPASLEADDIDVGRRAAWSVIARGTLRRASGASGLPDPEPWLDGKHEWLRLDVSAVSGRRFVGTPGTDGFTVEWGLAR